VSFGIVFHTIWQWTLKQARENGTSLETLSHNYGTPVVGETADWFLNDVHKSALEAEHVYQAFANALTQEEVQEGQNGGGAGMTCHMFPGGTGTSSRVVKGSGEVKYTVGVICQSNYGHTHDLQVGGVPIGKLILKEKGSTVHMKTHSTQITGKADDGSIVIYLM
jgi:D-aminopeptidase